jgi:hypothetical protein
MINDAQGYIPLIESFLEGKIKAKEFSRDFFEKIGNDNEPFEENNDFDDWIDTLCVYVDAYVDDETLKGGRGLESFERDENDLDENQLRTEVVRIYEEIKKLK